MGDAALTRTQIVIAVETGAPSNSFHTSSCNLLHDPLDFLADTNPNTAYYGHGSCTGSPGDNATVTTVAFNLHRVLQTAT
jgi:hypothetical protein